jgi:hypothetical protein
VGVWDGLFPQTNWSVTLVFFERSLVATTEMRDGFFSKDEVLI